VKLFGKVAFRRQAVAGTESRLADKPAELLHDEMRQPGASYRFDV
jgi:hypothetical protein